MQSESTTLFDRIGGEEAVDAAVTLFYKKVISDANVGHFFEDVDMDNQAEKMKKFMAVAFGAPIEWSGKDMRAAHSHMEITDVDFSTVASHLSDTLIELGLSETIVNEVMQIVSSTKDDVMNR